MQSSLQDTTPCATISAQLLIVPQSMVSHRFEVQQLVCELELEKGCPYAHQLDWTAWHKYITTAAHPERGGMGVGRWRQGSALG